MWLPPTRRRAQGARTVTLPELDPQACQRPRLPPGLHPSATSRQPAVCEKWRMPTTIACRPRLRLTPPDEGDVELHEVSAQLDDVAEVRRAGAGVIDGQADVGSQRPIASCRAA